MVFTGLILKDFLIGLLCRANNLEIRIHCLMLSLSARGYRIKKELRVDAPPLLRAGVEIL